MSRLNFLVFALTHALGLGLPVLAAPSSENDAVEAAQPNVAEHVAVEDTTADGAIEQRLSQIFKATEWFQDADVEVQDSVAFLNGKTETDQKKQWAGQLAGNTEGVAAVVNRIQVDKSLDLAETSRVVVASVKSLWKDFLTRSPLLVAGLFVLAATALFSKLANAALRRIAKRSRLRNSLQDLIIQLNTIGVWIIGLLIAAVVVFPGMTPSKAITVLGLGSIAIGFAFKDIFENFFAGILILWKYPFDRGDYIECGNIRGRIEDITIRTTLIRQTDGELVVLPNAMLFKNSVDVLTSLPIRRTTILCGVAYDTDLDEAQQVLQTATEVCKSVSDKRPVQILAQEFADSSINFEVTWWTGSTPLEIRESRDEVVRSIKRALDKSGIEIPFPQRTLWFPEGLGNDTQGALATADGQSS